MARVLTNIVSRIEKATNLGKFRFFKIDKLLLKILRFPFVVYGMFYLKKLAKNQEFLEIQLRKTKFRLNSQLVFQSINQSDQLSTSIANSTRIYITYNKY